MIKNFCQSCEGVAPQLCNITINLISLGAVPPGGLLMLVVGHAHFGTGPESCDVSAADSAAC